MRPKIVPQCASCVYFVPGMDSPSGQPYCRAFPDGIPFEILYGGRDHREPFMNESVTYKMAEGEEAERLFKAWERGNLELTRSKYLSLLSDVPDDDDESV